MARWQLLQGRGDLRSIQTISREGGKSIVAISTERTAEAMALVKDVLIS